MKIHTEIIGNLHAPEWAERAAGMQVETVELDQWTAQKSRLVARSDRGETYAVALERRSQLVDGDILEYRPDERRIVAVRIGLNDVMEIDLSSLVSEHPATIVRTAVELGHALGNQHWPAVVKELKVYVPLTVDRKVMESVMRTHRLEGVVCTFQPGREVIPYLAPHEVRRLFGGAERHPAHHHHDDPAPHRHDDPAPHHHDDPAPHRHDDPAPHHAR